MRPGRRFPATEPEAAGASPAMARSHVRVRSRQAVQGGSRMLKRNVLLTILTGSVIGALGTQVVPARAQPAGAAPAYYVAEFELRDPEGIRPYSAGVAADVRAVR